MKYSIDPQYVTDIIIHEQWSVHEDKTELTTEQLVDVLLGSDRCSSYHTEDHPEFARLRDQLESDGYIVTERRWWNGDSVLKKFTLNGVVFNPGDQFPSAAALQFRLGRNKKQEKNHVNSRR